MKLKNTQRNIEYAWHHTTNWPIRLPTWFSTQTQETIPLLLAGHGTFSKIDHIVVCRTHFNRCREFGTTPCSLSKFNGLKGDINNRKNLRKYTVIDIKECSNKSTIMS